jgi:NTE family protein
MPLFNFGRKRDGAKEYYLGEIPLFSALTLAEQQLIERTARLIEYKRGDLVYREGENSDAFYAVVSGRFRLFRRAKANFPEETLVYFYRGDHFGETSLLTGHPHSGSVEAKSDGLLLRLAKEDFLKLVNDIPTISLHLSRSLGHRLTQTEDTQGHREVKTIALYATSENEAILQLWMDLAAHLSEETKRKVALVDFAALAPRVLRDYFRKSDLRSFELQESDPSDETALQAAILQNSGGFQYLHVRDADSHDDTERKIKSLITFLSYRFNYLLLRLPAVIGHVTFKVLKKSDMVYSYSDCAPGHLEECSHALAEFQQGFGFSKSELRVLLPEDDPVQGISPEKAEKILGMPVFSLIPSKTRKADLYRTTLRHLAKELSGRLIGLALGCGAAHGLAHIGVLKVLEREGIRVDVVAGSSIGALIGALWSAGYEAGAIESLAKSVNRKNGFFKLIGLGDLTFPVVGFLKGHRIRRFLSPLLGQKTFRDLRIPCRIIATDFFTAEEIVMESGNLLDAVRASIAIPGIIAPVDHQGRYLTDGGIIDPLPVRVLAQMGVKKIIAVNVLQGPKELKEINRIKRENTRRWLETLRTKSLPGRIFSYGLHRILQKYQPNIFNAIMNSIQFMEYEMAEWWGAQADVLIRPVLQDAHWAEFYSPDKFIRAGEDRTLEQIDEIKRLIAE